MGGSLSRYRVIGAARRRPRSWFVRLVSWCVYELCSLLVVSQSLLFRLYILVKKSNVTVISDTVGCLVLQLRGGADQLYTRDRAAVRYAVENTPLCALRARPPQLLNWT
jgi:hypothetical protein